MIKEILPSSLKVDKKAESIVEAADKVIKELLPLIEKVLIVPNIDNVPSNILDLLAWQFHLEGYELAQTDEQKRNMIKKAIELHRYKGTKWAIKKVFEFLDIKATLKEWFEFNGEPYTFSVSLEGVISDDTPIAKLIELIDEYKNVRSKLAKFDFTAIRPINTQHITAASVLDLEPKTLPLEFFVNQEISSCSIFDADLGVCRFYFEAEERIESFAINDIELHFKPDVPLQPIDTLLVPNIAACVLELSDYEPSDTLGEYFDNDFELKNEASLSNRACVLLNLETEVTAGDFIFGRVESEMAITTNTILNMEV